MKNAVISIVLCIAASAAHSQVPSRWYLQANGAIARGTEASSDANARLAAAGATNISSKEVSGEAVAIGGGYGWSTLALEGTYFYSKPRSYHAGFQSSTNIGDSSRRWTAQGPGVSLVGRWPASSRVTVFAKASVYRLDTEVEARTNIRTPGSGAIVSSTDESTSGSQTAPGLAAGALIALGEGFHLSLALEQLRLRSGAFGAGNDIGDIRLFTFGLLYKL